MNLLDGAEEVIRGAGQFPRNGLNGMCRSTGMNLQLIDACDPDTVNVVGTPDSEVGPYSARPFGVQLSLKRSTYCEQADDKDHVQKVLDGNIDMPLGRALVIQPNDDTDTWIGNSNVMTVPLAGSTQDQYVAAIIAARALWKRNVLTPSGHPTLHVPPSLVPTLQGKILTMNGDDLVTVWQDPVVVSDGYDLLGTPRVFLSGPYKVYLLDTVADMVRQVRTNDSLVNATTAAVIDLEPCAIVRVGTYTP